MGALSTALIIGAGVAGGASQVSSGLAARRTANDLTGEGARRAREAVQIGEETVTRYRQDLDQLLGRQRALLAASIVDTTTGSAAQVRRQTEAFGAEDVETIRRNAMREAFGLRQNAEMQARGLRNQATGQIVGGGFTLLTSGVDAWGRWNAGRRGAMRATASTIGRDLAAWG